MVGSDGPVLKTLLVTRYHNSVMSVMSSVVVLVVVVVVVVVVPGAAQGPKDQLTTPPPPPPLERYNEVQDRTVDWVPKVKLRIVG